MESSENVKYKRLVASLADSVRSQYGTERQADYDQVKDSVTVGMLKKMKFLDIIPPEDDPAKEEQLLEQLLIADALEQLQGAKGSIIENELRPPEKPAAYREVVEELAGDWSATLAHGPWITRQQLENHFNRPMRNRLEPLGVVPAQEDPKETERLMKEMLVADALADLKRQGKLETRAEGEVEQFRFPSDGMSPLVNSGDTVKDEGISNTPLTQEGVEPVADLGPDVNERPAENISFAPNLVSPPEPQQEEVIEMKAGDDPTDEGRRQLDVHKIVIDPEFESLLQELTAEECDQLKANLLRDQVCHDPLKVWKGRNVLLDGHQRLPILREHPHILYTVEEIDLPDREAAKEWVLHNQFGRRNLAPDAASYYRGKLYESRKRQGERTDRTCGQNVHKSKTAERMAASFHVDAKTIRRDAQFASALDTIAENLGYQVRRDVLSGHLKVTKTDIDEIARMEPEQQCQAIKEASEAKKKDGPAKKKAGKKAVREKAVASQGRSMKAAPTPIAQAQDEDQVMAGAGQEVAPAPAARAEEQDREEVDQERDTEAASTAAMQVQDASQAKACPRRMDSLVALATECYQDITSLGGSLDGQERTEAILKAREVASIVRHILESLGEPKGRADGGQEAEPAACVS